MNDRLLHLHGPNYVQVSHRIYISMCKTYTTHYIALPLLCYADRWRVEKGGDVVLTDGLRLPHLTA